MDPNKQINPGGQAPVTPVPEPAPVAALAVEPAQPPAPAEITSSPIPVVDSNASPEVLKEQPTEKKKSPNHKFQIKFTKKTFIILGVIVLFLIVIIYFSISNSSLNENIADLRKTVEALTSEKQKLIEEKTELEKELEKNVLEQQSEKLLEEIPNGYYVYSLKLDSSISYGSEITPEMLIDIYLKTTIGGKRVNEAYVENVKVIMLRDAKGNNIYSAGASTKAEEIIFAVPKEIYQWIAKADDLTEITLYPVVKKGNAVMEPEMASQYLIDYVASKSVEIPED